MDTIKKNNNFGPNGPINKLQKSWNQKKEAPALIAGLPLLKWPSLVLGLLSDHADGAEK
jgi:hypothetical protein